ncbi:SH3 domain-containing protein [Marvinbryantia formatexigens]|nr:SH3 domain-containing protein [Marvinbryantia formatexigens]
MRIARDKGFDSADGGKILGKKIYKEGCEKMEKKTGRRIYFGLGSAMLAAALAGQCAAAENIWDCVETTDAQGRSVLQFEEVAVTIPADWNGLYEYEEDGDGVTFYQIASREKGREDGYDYMGNIFRLNCSENYDFMDYLPNYKLLGSGEHGVYYVTQPTDLRAYESDAAILEEYRNLQDDMEWIIDNTVISSPGEGAIDEDSFAEDMGSIAEDAYILENSFLGKLTAADLDGMNNTQLQMAINEIYARHHRKFETQSIQDYFNQKSWYSGTVEAADFNPGVLSQTEQENIAFILSSMSGEQETGTASAGQTLKKMYATTGVNLRDQASVEGKILAVVLSGAGVEITGQMTNGWMPVRYQGVNGYISAEYLSDWQYAPGDTDWTEQDPEDNTGETESYLESLGSPGAKVEKEGGMFDSDGIIFGKNNDMGYVHGTVTWRDGNNFGLRTADGTEISLNFVTSKIQEEYVDALQPGVEADIVYNPAINEVEVMTLY